MSAATVLFDLDGTLSDGGAGMIASLRYACDALDLPAPSEETLRSFIGPPFSSGFGPYFGLDDHDCARALSAYRQHYVDGGAMFETSAFAGIPELLDELVRSGRQLAVATSKPAVYARKVLEHLDLADRFAGIFGPDLDVRRATKKEVVGDACESLQLDRATTLMVGDREHDVIGARAHGIGCIGVLWGFGDRGELEAAGAVAIAAEPSELAKLLF